MKIGFHKLSLITRILILIDLYSEDLYEDDRKGIRVGDLLFILNREEKDFGITKSQRTTRDDCDKIIDQLRDNNIIRFYQGKTERYYYIINSSKRDETDFTKYS